jgi:hypothetical protein
MLIIALGEYDKKNRHYFHAEKLFHEGKYDELLRFNTEHPSTNSLTLFFNNIALCEKGLLNEKLFSFLTIEGRSDIIPEMGDGGGDTQARRIFLLFCRDDQ